MWKVFKFFGGQSVRQKTQNELSVDDLRSGAKLQLVKQLFVLWELEKILVSLKLLVQIQLNNFGGSAYNKWI